jgi:low affinity Fe/Cu permease
MTLSHHGEKSQPVRQASPKRTGQRHPGSRVLHVLDGWAARPTLAFGVVAAVVVWVLFSAVSGFPAKLESVFQTLASATTLAMVFVIQHTESRAQAATQRKLDEILRASPAADNTLITLEEAPDNELKAATAASRDARHDARHDPNAEPSAGHPGLDTSVLAKAMTHSHRA